MWCKKLLWIYCKSRLKI